MRPYIIIFIIVLCGSCFLNGPSEPYKWPVGIGGTDLKGKSELTKREGLIPEMQFVDKGRNVGIMTQIDDTPMTENTTYGEYPYAANN